MERNEINLSGRFRSLGRILFCVAGLSGARVLVNAEEAVMVTAVAAQVSADYARTPLPTGRFEAETYTFGEGGMMGGHMKDFSLEKLKFIDVARTIARPLRAQNYFPAVDPARTKLLIMVYWGATDGAGGATSSVGYQGLSAANQQMGNAQAALKALGRGEDPLAAKIVSDTAKSERDAALFLTVVENRLREKADWQNAGILGYSSGMIAAHGHEETPLNWRQQDLIDDVEDGRYFVVLMAYDFQLLLKEKKHKLLWETRFSIRQRDNDFDQQLAAMAQYASRYFGQDSHGLVRKPMPKESIRLDELKILGVEPGK